MGFAKLPVIHWTFLGGTFGFCMPYLQVIVNSNYYVITDRSKSFGNLQNEI